MNVPWLPEFVLWSFFALSIVVLAPLGYGIYDISVPSEDEWPKFTSIVAGLLAAMALMTCSLVLLGHSTSALWVWRGVSAIVSVLSGLFWVATLRWKRRNPNRSGPGIPLVFAATAVAILFFVGSIGVGTLPDVATHSSAPSVVIPAATVLIQLSFWHAALYVMLALASVTCGMLFVASSRSDGPLSFERSGGGLGVGSSGWEVSNSLTYLIATLALSALLMALIFHNDTMDQEREKRREDAAHKASAPANLITPSTLAAPKPETGKTVPAPPHPAGTE